MTETNNPLRKFFRQPAIYIKLPSNGKFYPKGTLEMPANGELPVYPMTAIDEITYRTSDALFNGAAISNVVISCVPAIKDGWHMPQIDLDAVLVAIRIASYGHEMEINSNCPKCENENSFTVDLRMILDGIKYPDYNSTVTLGDIEVHFKPLSYKEMNANSMEQFNDQKIMEALPQANISEAEKIQQLGQAFAKLTRMTVTALRQSISMIKAQGEIVVDAQHIEEFILNSERHTFDNIKNHIEKIRKDSELKPLPITCTKCSHAYETPFTLDVSNFFVGAS